MLSAAYLPANCGGIRIDGITPETSLLEVFKKGSKTPWGGGFYRYQRSAPLWILTALITPKWQIYKDIKAKKDRHWHLIPVGEKFFAFRLIMREKGWNSVIEKSKAGDYNSVNLKDWGPINYFYGFYSPSPKAFFSRMEGVKEPTIFLGCISLHTWDPPTTRQLTSSQIIAGKSLKEAGFRVTYFDNPIHSHSMGFFWKVVNPTCKTETVVKATRAAKTTSKSGRRLSLGAKAAGVEAK